MGVIAVKAHLVWEVVLAAELSVMVLFGFTVMLPDIEVVPQPPVRVTV
jgi:hypothetical protein